MEPCSGPQAGNSGYPYPEHRPFFIEKLEYSRYNAKIKYERICNNNYSSGFLSYTNGYHEGFVEFYVIEDFKFWVILRWMKE